MTESIRRLSIKRSFWAVVLIAFATISLPGFHGNPTGLMLLHNHATRFIKRNEAAIATSYAIAEKRDDRMVSQIGINILELLIIQTIGLEDSKYKDQKIAELELRLDKYNNKFSSENDSIRKLQEQWARYKIASN
jgi:hypothetical protein